MPSEFSELSTR